MIELQRLWSFVHKTVRTENLRGRFRRNHEDVAVEAVDRETLECHSLPVAIEAVSADQVMVATIKISSSRRSVDVVWRCDDGGRIVVGGMNPVWVKGVAGILEGYLAKRQYKVETPTRAKWWLQGWNVLLVGVVASLIAAVIVAVVDWLI